MATDISAHERSKDVVGNSTRVGEEAKSGVMGYIEVTDVEEGEGQKTFYSKASVVFMVIFSGLAIGSDGYNASVIGNIELLLAVLYPESLTSSIYTRLSNAFLIGMIIGMIMFGVIADQLGRKTGAVATTLLLVLGIVLSTAASGTSETGMFWMLIVARGIAGVGAGGEYPVSGAGAAEATDESAGMRKHRGFMFAMIADLSASLGYVFGGLVPLLLLLCVHEKVEHYNTYGRLHSLPQSFDEETEDPLSFGDQAVLETLAWRFNDLVPIQLGWGVVINCFYIPGPFIGGYLSDKIGRRKTMAIGFALQAALGFILGGAINQIQPIFPLFVVMYGIFLTLGEVGPGSTVVLTSSECFPTAIRGQMMGFASAVSKAGAAIGTQVFTPISNSAGDQGTFLVGAGFAVVGACIAYFVIPDVGRNLEDEDENWKKYLEENGWAAEWGDAETRDPKSVVIDSRGS